MSGVRVQVDSVTKQLLQRQTGYALKWQAIEGPDITAGPVSSALKQNISLNRDSLRTLGPKPPCFHILPERLVLY